MQQKRMLHSFVVLVFLFVLTLIAGWSDTDIAKTNAQEIGTDEIEDETEEGTEVINSNIEIETDIDKAVKIIVSKCNKAFISYYPVDEAFLCWFAEQYGEGSLQDIAYYAQQGYTDTQKWYDISGKSIHVLWAEYCLELNTYTYMLEDIKWIDGHGENKDEIVIDFVGDINFDDKWYTMKKASTMQKGVSDCFSEAVKEELCSADVTVVNNEFTYSDSKKPLEGKDYVFKAKKEAVEYLNLFGTDIVSIANNHVYDYGKEGLESTIEVLKKAGIDTVGAGNNIEEASTTQYYIVDGRKIGIISATQIEKFSHYTKAATQKEAGVFKMLDPSLLIEKIQKDKQICDFLIAFVHWGNEGTEFFEFDQVELAKQMAEAGVDAIVGGHPHRLQGCEFIENVPVAYSIGNFWFSTGSLYTSIAQIRIDKDGKLAMRMIPCLQKGLVTSVIEDEKQIKKFYEYLADISGKIGIDADGTLHDLKEEKNAGNKDKYKYKSEKYYSKHSSNYDIDGNRIDRVGNLE